MTDWPWEALEKPTPHVESELLTPKNVRRTAGSESWTASALKAVAALMCGSTREFSIDARM